MRKRGALLAEYKEQLKQAKKSDMTKSQFRDATGLNFGEMSRLENSAGISLRSKGRKGVQREFSIMRTSKFEALQNCPKLNAYIMTTRFSDVCKEALECFGMGTNEKRREVNY